MTGSGRGILSKILVFFSKFKVFFSKFLYFFKISAISFQNFANLLEIFLDFYLFEITKWSFFNQN